jgi:glycosyltransferase involved in cell wall biosynthesis
MLLQEYPPFEIVLVTLKDDSNLPALKQMKAMFGDERMRIIIAEKANPYSQRNVGLRKARGDLITFCDSDDVLLPNKLWFECSLLMQRQAALIYTSFFTADDHMNITGTFKHDGWSQEAMRKEQTIPDYAMVPRKVWEEIGWLDPELQAAATWDAWLRIMERYPKDMHYRRVPTWIYRRRPGMLSELEEKDPSQWERRNETRRRHYERCGEEVPQ